MPARRNFYWTLWIAGIYLGGLLQRASWKLAKTFHAVFHAALPHAVLFRRIGYRTENRNRSKPMTKQHKRRFLRRPSSASVFASARAILLSAVMLTGVAVGMFAALVAPCFADEGAKPDPS